MKIPKDVSSTRKAFALARLKRQRKETTVPNPEKKKHGEDPRVAKARQEAIDSRKKLQAKAKEEAEKDARIAELQEALDAANKELEDARPAAADWNKYSHTRKETLIAKFPKEDQSRIRKMDLGAVEYLASRLKIAPEGGGSEGGGNPGGKAGTKITSLEDAAKADAATYNKFMDDIKAGTIKIDGDGKVLA